jgi:hypothetical protein
MDSSRATMVSPPLTDFRNLAYRSVYPYASSSPVGGLPERSALIPVGYSQCLMKSTSSPSMSVILTATVVGPAEAEDGLR